MTSLFRAAIGLTLLVLVALLPVSSRAQTSDDLRVVTRAVTPFVMKDGDTYSGFSVDLWQAVAKELGRSYTFVEKNNVKDILDGVKAGEGDLAISAISITSEREDQFDFSQPMFDSGLQIMVRDDADQGFSWRQVWTLLSTGGVPILLGVLAALIVIPAHIAWFFERKHDNHMFPPNYFPGIFHAMWWATGAAAGQQPDPVFSGWGRLLSTILILVSAVFMSYFTATITTVLTVQQLKGDINGPGDLPGRKVGTTPGSTAASFLRVMRVEPAEYSKIEDAFLALENKQIDAVLFDAPVLLYYAANKGQGKVRLVGGMLKRENYGILFPQGSALRKPVSEALLKLQEDGTYDALYAKWFGGTKAATQ